MPTVQRRDLGDIKVAGRVFPAGGRGVGDAGRAIRERHQAQGRTVHFGLLAAGIARRQETHLDIGQVSRRAENAAHVKSRINDLIIAVQRIDVERVPNACGSLIDLELGLTQALLLEYETQIDQAWQVGRVNRRRKGVGLPPIRIRALSGISPSGSRLPSQDVSLLRSNVVGMNSAPEDGAMVIPGSALSVTRTPASAQMCRTPAVVCNAGRFCAGHEQPRH